MEQANTLLRVQEKVFPNSPLSRDGLLKALQTDPPQAMTIPGLRHVLIAAACALVFVSMLLLWPAGYLVRRLQARASEGSIHSQMEQRLCRVVCALAALVALLFWSSFS
jgi:hypothetical protein